MMIDAFDGYGLIYTCYNGVKQFVRQFLFFVNLFAKDMGCNDRTSISNITDLQPPPAQCGAVWAV